MTIREEYEKRLKQQDEIINHPMGRIWLDKESRYMEPFRIYGNVYYVGDSWVCVHIVDTGDGLLMIDAGNCGATDMLIHAIWSAGFNPADIKWIILSHGHVDHVGGVNFMRKMFGSKIYLGEPDVQMFKEHPELSYIYDSSNIVDSIFEPDEIIHDGDMKKFGNTEIKFYMVPGHTMGTIACFFNISDGTEVKRAGYYGGFGFNTLQKDYLIEIGDTEYKNRQIYLNSLDKVRNEHVDVFLGNHTNNNNLIQKLDYLKEHPSENPFVDTTEWGKYLDEKKNALLEFMADPNNN